RDRQPTSDRLTHQGRKIGGGDWHHAISHINHLVDISAWTDAVNSRECETETNVCLGRALLRAAAVRWTFGPQPRLSNHDIATLTAACGSGVSQRMTISVGNA